MGPLTPRRPTKTFIKRQKREKRPKQNAAKHFSQQLQKRTKNTPLIQQSVKTQWTVGKTHMPCLYTEKATY